MPFVALMLYWETCIPSGGYVHSLYLSTYLSKGESFLTSVWIYLGKNNGKEFEPGTTRGDEVESIGPHYLPKQKAMEVCSLDLYLMILIQQQQQQQPY